MWAISLEDLAVGLFISLMMIASSLLVLAVIKSQIVGENLYELLRALLTSVVSEVFFAISLQSNDLLFSGIESYVLLYYSFSFCLGVSSERG